MKRMSARIEWLNQDNQKQREWLTKYFLQNYPKKRVHWLVNDYESIIANIKTSNDNDGELIDFLTKMKAAWKQKEIRDKKDGRKSDTNIIQIKSIHTLKKLAKYYNIPKNKMLEIIIEHFDEERNIEKDEYIIFKDKKDAEVSRLKSIIKQQKSEIESLNVQLKISQQD